jgi:hypothetical protein
MYYQDHDKLHISNMSTIFYSKLYNKIFQKSYQRIRIPKNSNIFWMWYLRSGDCNIAIFSIRLINIFKMCIFLEFFWVFDLIDTFWNFNLFAVYSALFFQQLLLFPLYQLPFLSEIFEMILKFEEKIF